MANQSIPASSSESNSVSSTYRLRGSCDVRMYVYYDDTPYHLETPEVHTLPNPNPNHTPERAAKAREIVRILGGYRWLQVSDAMLSLMDEYPEATAAELVNMFN